MARGSPDPARGGGRDGAEELAPEGPGTSALIFHPHVGRAASASPRGRGGERSPAARLAEAESLAAGIGLVVARGVVVQLRRIIPATYVGRGKLDELAELVRAAEIDVVIADCALTPVQQRNLERALAAKVIDRTGLILEIFGARAQTKEGSLQVELAHLDYQRSRLVRSWTHLERQRGGFGFLGGPGERQIETDRRLIGKRITRIRHELETVTRTRSLHRLSRRRVPYPVVALVGYTNAGKSTLFNRLTKARVAAAERLFETLDPTMRRVALPSGRDVIMSDTVGFISNLPTELVAAFRATLEEVVEADIILHVRDISHQDSAAQRRDVYDVLGELGIGENDERPLIEALNKIDLLGDEARGTLFNRARRRPGTVPISAATGQGCDRLLAAIEGVMARDRVTVDVEVAVGDSASIAWLYRRGEVIGRSDGEGGSQLRVRLQPADLGRLRKRPGVITHNADPRPREQK